MAATIKSPEPKLLASNDKKTRDAACKQLKAALAAPSTGAELPESSWDDYELDARFSEASMLQLHKGLFYCMWMSDKPLVQQALTDRLSNLLLELAPANATGRPARTRCALSFLRGFWTTMAREWPNIDRLRMDKYLLLCRRFSEASLRLLDREEFDERVVREYIDVLVGKGGPLNVMDTRIPVGLISHVADTLLASIAALIASRETDRPIPLLDLYEPFVRALAAAPTKTSYNVVFSHAFEPLFTACAAAAEAERPAKRRKHEVETDASAVAVLAGPIALPGRETVDAAAVGHALARRLFDRAQLPETSDTNRRKLYEVMRQHGDDETV